MTAGSRPQDSTISEDDFASLYRSGIGRLVGFFRAKGIGAEEAADLAHETICRTLLHLKRHGRTQQDIGPLSRTIARNLLVERLRRAGPQVVALSDEMDAPDEAPEPADLAVAAERREAVRVALASLTPRHRRVIELWMEGLRPAEIARELGIKRNAADAILHRARRTLASRLGPRALWGGIALAWLRFRNNARHASQQLAAWSPDGAALAPAGISLATVGLAAMLTIAAPQVASSDAGRDAPRPLATVTAERSADVPRVSGAPDIVDVSAPTAPAVKAVRVQAGPSVGGEPAVDMGMDFKRDPQGRGIMGPLVEQVATQLCASTGGCVTEEQ